jgi:hypothetical protein
MPMNKACAMLRQNFDLISNSINAYIKTNEILSLKHTQEEINVLASILVSITT